MEPDEEGRFDETLIPVIFRRGDALASSVHLARVGEEQRTERITTNQLWILGNIVIALATEPWSKGMTTQCSQASPLRFNALSR